MNNTKLDSESTNLFLSKEELKKLLTEKKDKIQTVLRKYGCTKAITLSATLTGEFAISTAGKILIPASTQNIEHWHYSCAVKLDKKTAEKKTCASIMTKHLIDGICAQIESVTWYVGLQALSI
jgi:hypothetical protein